jgi:malate dehydrogenase (oxaloacetate-decarboxylating)
MINQKIIEISKKIGGKIEVVSKAKVTKKNLPILYTPGVADICKHLVKKPKDAFIHTIKKNTVAVISDGSAVLGLGNIGPIAGLPVMEGKSLLFKEFANVDAFPIMLNTQDTEEIIKTIKNISPGFGGINLEDISAPRCFEIEERLKAELDIPVFHDDQHGTAIVVLAALYNALVVVGKKINKIKIIIAGAGAAGIAVAKLLHKAGARNIIVVDTAGAISQSRMASLNISKQEILNITNPNNQEGSLKEVISGADVFIGVSAPNIINSNDVSKMNEKSIVFAMGNPIPEIMPDEAKKGGAHIIATGRSDFPNQINNILVFPGIFRGALDKRVKNITENHKIKAAKALAALVLKPSKNKIIVEALDKRAVKVVSNVF